MTSGTTLRRVLLALALLPTALQAAELDTDALLASLARPAPDTTSFVEVRHSALLSEPTVVAGRLEHRADGALVRYVESPYRETTVLDGENVRVEREGSRPRRFSLDRAPELRGMLASFGALLRGDRGTLEQHFTIETSDADQGWRIELIPRDEKLRRRVAAIRVDGAGDSPRCFTVAEPDGDASVMALGVRDRDALPQSLEVDALQAWCAGVPER